MAGHFAEENGGERQRDDRLGEHDARHRSGEVQAHEQIIQADAEDHRRHDKRQIHEESQRG